MADEDPPDESKAISTLVGTVLGERYRLERVLGAGGMGAVFEGKDLRLGRPVAVKVMQPGYARDAEYTKRFLREAQTCSMIRHRNVVVILDYGKTDEELVYSVMELLVGQDLEALLRVQPGQRLPWAQACGLLVQISSGLKAAHGRGVIHRDIKPASCFLAAPGHRPRRHSAVGGGRAREELLHIDPQHEPPPSRELHRPPQAPVRSPAHPARIRLRRHAPLHRRQRLRTQHVLRHAIAKRQRVDPPPA